MAPATALLDRLNVHSIDGVDVRREVLGIVAHHLKPGMWHKVREEVGDGAFRRLAQKVNLELLAGSRNPIARAAAARSTAPRWTGSSIAHVRSASSISRPRPGAGPPPVPLGVAPGPAHGTAAAGEIYERQLDGEVTTTEEGVQLARRMLRGEH